MSNSSFSEAFPQTAWGYVEILKDSANPQHAPALDTFVRRYWKPAYCFLRARGHDRHHAEDLTQGFFARFLERDWIDRADPQRGRFRNYLLKLLTRYVADQKPGRAPRQAAFESGVATVGALLNAEENAVEPAVHETPESAFLRQWALATVDAAHERLRMLCHSRDRSTWFDLFRAVHVKGKRGSQETIAVELGWTRDQVRYALQQTEEWFRVLLREELRSQVENDPQVDEELDTLMSLLGTN